MGLVRRKSKSDDATSKQSTPTNLQQIDKETTSPSSTSVATSVGMGHWLETRRKWTAAAEPSPTSDTRQIVDLDDANMLLVYNSMVKDARVFSKPQPMSFVVKSLVRGWKSEGVYVEGTENWD